MSAARVFACPSCGASISTGGEEAQTKCQFCGNTVVVPAELRPKQPAGPQVFVTTTRVETSRAGRRLASLILVIVLVSVLCPALIGLGITLLGAGAGIAALAPAATAIAEVSTVAVSTAPTEIEMTAAPAFAELVLTFGGEGTGPGRFDDARGIALDGPGNIYVSEFGTGRIQKFDASGQFILSWIASEDGVTGLAVNRSGAVYAVDGAILKFDGAAGQPSAQIEGADSFYGATALPDGGLLAFTRDDLVRLDADGQEVSRIPQPLQGHTDGPGSIGHLAVDGLGNIFLLSDFDSAVFKFTPDGQFVDKFGSEGAAPGQFGSWPTAIAVDGRGRVYVCDSDRILVFTNEGQYLHLIEIPGNAVFDMEFNDQGELFVLSRNAAQVYKFAVNEPE